MTESLLRHSGAVLVQQLMAYLIGQHAVLFPQEEDSPDAPELCNNNNNEVLKRQNTENNNTSSSCQCTWEMPNSPGQGALDNTSPRSSSPLNVSTTQRFDVTRSPTMTVKKNPAFSKGSGIVTNGSFSSSSSSSEEKSPTLVGTSQMRRMGALKASGTRMGMQNGGVRMGVCSTDIVNGTLNGRNGLWSPPGGVTLREVKGRDVDQQNRLSTYDNVHVQHTPCQPCQSCPNTNCEDKQSVDSATWSTSSCEISLPDVSCRSSTTTCPEPDFSFEDPLVEKGGRRSGGSASGEDRASRGTSSSENSEVSLHVGGHGALHSLVAGLKQEMFKQKSDYDATVKR